MWLLNWYNELFSSYDRLMHYSDKRVSNWPLMSSPLPTVAISLTYVLTAKYLGPALMKNREPFNIKYLMVGYNFMMVIISSIIVYYFAIYAWFNGYSYRCQPVDYSDSYDAVMIAKISYLYFIVKFLEFTDTLFFILRKKFTHVSTLHVIHHGILPFSVWWGMKFVPGGHATFFGYINSFIHIIMYTYYGLAACGPAIQKYLWWKKYLTVFQMVQFVIIFVHAFQLLFQNNCNFPKIFALWIGAHGVLFWFLFSEFYESAYNKKMRRSVSVPVGEGDVTGRKINGFGHQVKTNGVKTD